MTEPSALVEEAFVGTGFKDDVTVAVHRLRGDAAKAQAEVDAAAARWRDKPNHVSAAILARAALAAYCLLRDDDAGPRSAGAATRQ